MCETMIPVNVCAGNVQKIVTEQVTEQRDVWWGVNSHSMRYPGKKASRGRGGESILGMVFFPELSCCDDCRMRRISEKGTQLFTRFPFRTP